MGSGKQLYRSSTNKMLAGICGGIGDYFGIDPTIIRILWVVLSLALGFGLLAYLLCAIIIPKKD